MPGTLPLRPHKLHALIHESHTHSQSYESQKIRQATLTNGGPRLPIHRFRHLDQRPLPLDRQVPVEPQQFHFALFARRAGDPTPRSLEDDARRHTQGLAKHPENVGIDTGGAAAPRTPRVERGVRDARLFGQPLLGQAPALGEDAQDERGEVFALYLLGALGFRAGLSRRHV